MNYRNAFCVINDHFFRVNEQVNFKRDHQCRQYIIGLMILQHHLIWIVITTTHCNGDLHDKSDRFCNLMAFLIEMR